MTTVDASFAIYIYTVGGEVRFVPCDCFACAFNIVLDLACAHKTAAADDDVEALQIFLRSKSHGGLGGRN